MPTALIAANGQIEDPQQLQRMAGQVDQIIAADGGANALMKYGICPDLVIGDLDSIDQSQFKHKKTHLIHIADQQWCDLEKTLSYCKKQGYQTLHFFGLGGGRADFSFANYIILQRFAPFFSQLYVYGKNYWAVPVQAGTYLLRQEKGVTVSLVPMSCVQDISLSGFEYEVNQENWEWGQLGVSNKIELPECKIRFKQGKIWLFVFSSGDAGIECIG